MDINSTWAKILPIIDLMVKEDKPSRQNFLRLHKYVYEYCTNIDVNDIRERIKKNTIQEASACDINGRRLYLKLKEYLTAFCNNLLEQSDDLMNEDLLQFYCTKWDKYEFSARGLQGAFCYLNRHWIKIDREINGKYGSEASVEVYTLAIAIWKDTLFNKYNTQLENTVIRLLNCLRERYLVKTELIQQFTNSYTAMGICHDGETRSLILYKNQFEKKFLKESENFYNLERADFLKDKSVGEYLKKVDKRLQDEANKISICLDLSTKDILIKTAERVFIQNQLEQFLDQFRELIELEKYDDLQLMYFLVNRNPEDMGKFIEEFKNLVNSEGLSSIKRCGEAVKQNSKMYTNAILEIYKKYAKTLMAFNNSLEYKTALDEACSKFVNRNFVTEQPNSVRKSSELIVKYCDQLMKKSNSCLLNDFDQAIEDVIILYRFIYDKDVFQEYYVNLLSKRLLNPEYYDQDFDILMMSKLKEHTGIAYALQLERMLRDLVLSEEISKDFSQNNTEELKVDFNIMVLQAGSWPFRKSPDFTLPLELEKCVSQFSKYYSVKHAGKRLLWLYNLSKGEIVTSNFKKHYTFLCSSMQIAILLLFNKSTTWSLTQLHEQTNIEMELILKIVEILLKIKIVTCEKPECLTPDTMISLNQLYNNKKLRININLPIKLEIKHDQEVLNKNIEEKRKFVLQAKIIQIMKDRKTLRHRELIDHTFRALSSKFELQVSVIKKTIDLLIEKYYLERDSRKETYTYIA